MDLNEYLPLMIDASRDAGIEIMEVYNSENFDVEQKNDHSPLTRADKLANEAILEKLRETDFPVLSEEGKQVSYEERKKWEYFWMIDPLDGTKEFIKQNDEFTVNIALIHKNEPILGVVYAPALDKLYYGGKGIGAFKSENMDPQVELKLIKHEKGPTKIVASRSHLNKETEEFIAKYKNAETLSMGSSLKFMLLADSDADIYPRFSPTMEWDTAAAHAILRGLDLDVIDIENDRPLRYNKENLLNPNFLVER
ncbi:3'(2'),5'-bisphosphate nucleotidase CysQ [Mesonia maritima]|uniref:3'(2'),5'-bisphosphate nucleotidase CysQ n=1 Tax=Mesonia maritima TaxID=1793873 RepID=A0ABU1K2I1_9FLAO|nr:3'(2'),5'-bisphosphate nucleotidase CysQ [Mesonia maritima]MDR6299812.1 3'(2'), 5'-bisphosphate nucleotidase [Mesonia maritima]